MNATGFKNETDLSSFNETQHGDQDSGSSIDDGFLSEDYLDSGGGNSTFSNYTFIDNSLVSNNTD